MVYFIGLEACHKKFSCQLIISQCLPILLYGLECFLFSFRQLQKISVELSCVFRRIFSLLKWTSVRNLFFFVGIYPSTVLIDERRLFLLHNCFRQNNLLKLCCDYVLMKQPTFTTNVTLISSKYHLKTCIYNYARIYCRL